MADQEKRGPCLITPGMSEDAKDDCTLHGHEGLEPSAKEPWEAQVMGGDTWIAVADQDTKSRIVLQEIGEYHGAQVKRAVECVNACAGLEDPEQAVRLARAALKLVKHRFEERPGGDQLGQADGEMVADALRRLGG